MNIYIILIVLIVIACLIMLILTHELSNIVIEQEKEIEDYRIRLTTQITLNETQYKLLDEMNKAYLLQKKVIDSNNNLIDNFKNTIKELENKC